MQTNKLLQHPPALCNMIRRIAIAAGDVTLDYFDEAGFAGAESKDDGSPVTAADRAAEAIIEKGLRDILPGIPMIGEEACAEGRIPSLENEPYFWLVDPLDGTKEFISGGGDYTVNIALIHQGVPILGVIYAPVTGELYAGCGPGTAIRSSADTDRDKSIQVRRAPSGGLTVVASRHHANQAALDEFLLSYKVEKIIKRGSSLKICAVAAGKADLYPRFGQTGEWDTAAGDAILRAAGGGIVDKSGKSLTYGHAGRRFVNPEFIAAGDDFLAALFDNGA